MKVTDEKVLLFIEPTHERTEPIIDDTTLKIVHALRHPVKKCCLVDHDENGKVKIFYNIATEGYHDCICRAYSGDHDFGIKIGDKIFYTNSLASHYIACHRSEVSRRDLDLVDTLSLLENEDKPSTKEIYGLSDDEMNYRSDEENLFV